MTTTPEETPTETPSEPAPEPTPDFDLLKVDRAINDPDFAARVRAAGIIQSVAEAAPAKANGNRKWFGIFSLINPQVVDQSMLALVASDPEILRHITLENRVADTSMIPDAALKTAVAKYWDTVAAKYPTNPLAPPATA